MNRTDNRRRTILICVLLGAVTLASYWPVLRNGFVTYDDPDYVSENPYVLRGLTWQNAAWAFQAMHVANWHPLTWLSHMLDVQLFGLQPAGHHLTSLLLHMVNTLLLFIALRAMTGARWRSALVAALFALHPLHVESVAWVSERKDVLSAFFFILTLVFYARYAEGRRQKVECRMQKAEAGDTQHATGKTPRSAAPSSTFDVQRSMFDVRPSSPRFWYWAAVAMFACGLMSKAMLVTLPFLLLLLDYWPLQRFQLSTLNSQPSTLRRLALEKLPFLLLAIASSAVTFVAQQSGGAVRSLEAFTPGFRIANALVSYARYLGKTIWPAGLAAFYPTPNEWPLAWVFGAALLLAALTALCVWQVRRAPYLAVGWFWFLGTLVPVIGIVQVGMQSMADRYTYLPLIGVFIAAVWAAADYVEGRMQNAECRMQKPESSNTPRSAVPSSMFDVQRSTFDVHLPAAASAAPEAPATQGSKFDVRRSTFDVQSSTSDVQPPIPSPAAPEAAATQGSKFDVQSSTSDVQPPISSPAAEGSGGRRVRLGLGLRLGIGIAAAVVVLLLCGYLTWRQTGFWRTSASLFAHAVAVTRDNEVAQNDLGACLLTAGNVAAAEPHFAEAVRIRPKYADALMNLALCRFKQGRVPEAIDCFQRSLDVAPTAAGHYNLAIVLKGQGRIEEAEAHYRAALRLRPYFVEAWYNLGSLKQDQGDAEAAARAYATALQFRPDHTGAHSNLGQVLTFQHKWDEAIAHLRTGLRAAPQNAEAHFYLGAALASTGKYAEAAVEFGEACRLRPDYTLAHERLGEALVHQGKLPEAVSQLKQALQARPGSAMSHYYLALALHLQGQFDEALPNYREAARLDPNAPNYLNDLAWILATHPKAEVRDGSEAVRLAEAACRLTEQRQPALIGTLAAAYAETGRFADAIKTAERARDLAAAAGLKELADKNRQLIELYRAGKPYHEADR